MSAECSSYRVGNRICKDGFIQTPACRGRNTCFCCGSVIGNPPWCMREDIPGHHVKEDGSPFFYRAALRDGNGGDL